MLPCLFLYITIVSMTWLSCSFGTGAECVFMPSLGFWLVFTGLQRGVWKGTSPALWRPPRRMWLCQVFCLPSEWCWGLVSSRAKKTRLPSSCLHKQNVPSLTEDEAAHLLATGQWRFSVHSHVPKSPWAVFYFLAVAKYRGPGLLVITGNVLMVNIGGYEKEESYSVSKRRKTISMILTIGSAIQ